MTYQTHEEWAAEKAAKDWWLPRALEWLGDHCLILAYRLRGMVDR